MRVFRSTLIMAVVVLTVIYISYREYGRQQQSEKEKEIQERVIKNWKEEDVNEIKLHHSNFNLLLKKENEEWSLLEPLKDLASATKIKNYLSSFFKKKAKILLKSSQNDPSSEPINWSDYGLESPGYTFQLKAALSATSTTKKKKKPLPYETKKSKESKEKKGETLHSESLRIDLSSFQSYDGKYFLRINKGEELLLAQGSWTDLTSSDAESFREKKFFVENWAPHHFLFQFQKKKFEFQKKQGEWVFLKNESLKIDSDFLSQLVNEIRDLKADKFSSESSKNQSLVKYRLHRPRWIVQLSHIRKPGLTKKEAQDLAEIKKWELKLSPPKNKVIYADVSRRNFIGQISEGTVKNWPKKLNDFRDKNHPFSFDQELAFHVSLFWNNKTLNFEKIEKKEETKKSSDKKEKKWKLLGQKSSEKEVKEPQLLSFLRQISRLKAEDFLGSQFQSRTKKNHISIKDASGNILLHLNWNKTLNRKKETFYYVSSQKISDTLLIKKKSLEDILDIQLTEKKKKTDSNSQTKEKKSQAPSDTSKNTQSKSSSSETNKSNSNETKEKEETLPTSTLSPVKSEKIRESVLRKIS